MLNNKYKIIVTDPLIRPGLKIETECSIKYLPQVVSDTMNSVRQINKSFEQKDVDVKPKDQLRD